MAHDDNVDGSGNGYRGHNLLLDEAWLFGLYDLLVPPDYLLRRGGEGGSWAQRAAMCSYYPATRSSPQRIYNDKKL